MKNKKKDIQVVLEPGCRMLDIISETEKEEYLKKKKLKKFSDIWLLNGTEKILNVRFNDNNWRSM